MSVRTRLATAALAAVAILAAVLLVGVARAAGPSYQVGSAVAVHRVGRHTVTILPKPHVTTTPDSAPSTPTAAPLGGFTLHREYTFSGTTLEHDWSVYDSSYGGDPDARVPGLVTVSGDRLHVATTGKQGSGLCLCRGDGKPSAPYGRWDIRARATADADHGFAILLWPNAENWPAGGEIDIAEFPGAARSKLQTTVHYGSTNRQITGFTAGDFTQWHTYSVVWTRTSITYLLDGATVMTVTDASAIPHDAMHLALQAGVNPGVASPSATSASLVVEWVKVYR